MCLKQKVPELTRTCDAHKSLLWAPLLHDGQFLRFHSVELPSSCSGTIQRESVTSIALSGRITGRPHRNKHRRKWRRNTGTAGVTVKISWYLFHAFCGNSSNKHNNKTGFKHLVSCHLKMIACNQFLWCMCHLCFITVFTSASKS